MWALLTAEQMRLNYCEATNEQTAASAGSVGASDQTTQPASRGSGHAGSKGPVASADKEITWQHCLKHAQAAVQAWQGCVHAETTEEGGRCEGLADADVLSQLMLELHYMAGLHGETCSYAFPFAVPLLSLCCPFACPYTNALPFPFTLSILSGELLGRYIEICEWVGEKTYQLHFLKHSNSCTGSKPLIALCHPSRRQVTFSLTLCA